MRLVDEGRIRAAKVFALRHSILKEAFRSATGKSEFPLSKKSFLTDRQQRTHHTAFKLGGVLLVHCFESSAPRK